MDSPSTLPPLPGKSGLAAHPVIRGFMSTQSMMHRPAKLLVTAFKAFGGRKTNASLLALRELKKSLPTLRTRILPVDSALAPLRLRHAIRQLRPAIILMLGEAGGSREIRLETTAWNELDFRIPDAAGRQPRSQPIHSGAPPNLTSTVPFKELLGPLVSAGHPVVLSDDAGRYLCNQVLFETLHFTGNKQHDCITGFVHLPLEQELPTEICVAALLALIRETARAGLTPCGVGETGRCCPPVPASSPQ